MKIVFYDVHHLGNDRCQISDLQQIDDQVDALFVMNLIRCGRGTDYQMNGNFFLLFTQLRKQARKQGTVEGRKIFNTAKCSFFQFRYYFRSSPSAVRQRRKQPFVFFLYDRFPI